MLQKAYAIPPGSRLLVTGASGYIASHVVNILLQLGYSVRGTVRAEKPWLDKYFASRYPKDRYESVIVPAMEEENAFESHMKGIAGIIHIVCNKASDTTLKPEPDTVIPRVVAGTVNILKSAARYNSIKRVVVTSSSTAVLIPKPNERRSVDQNTWNDEVSKAAWSESVAPEKKPYIVYAAAKTEAERQAWNWVAENQPGFGFNVVVPNINFGRFLIPDVPAPTMRWTCNLLRGDSKAIEIFPPKWFVDVEDDARIHVAALLDPTINLERIFAFASPQNWTDVIGILRKLRPDNKLIPDPPKDEGRDLTEVIPSRRAEEILRSFFGKEGWTSLEDSIAAGIEGAN